MSEERRVFKMETVLNLIAGKGGSDVSELLAFLTERDLTPKDEGLVAALAKAWIYSQHPPFMDCKYSPIAVFDEWVAQETKRLGDNLSIAPIPEGEMTPINSILDAIAADKATIAEQAETIEELEGKVASLEPIPAKIPPLEKKIEDLNAKIKTLDETIKSQKAQIAAWNGMVPIAEAELNSSINDIVVKALKAAVASVPLGAAGGAAGEAGAVAEESSSDSGGVPDSFGFGATSDSGDGFSF